MPIYEYRCSACGFQKEYLQKLSDPRLTVCPECHKETFSKMLTAAGFQLKGSGWYATDFKNKSAPASKPDGDKGGDKGVDKSSGDGGKSESKPESSAAPACGTGACPACS